MSRLREQQLWVENVANSVLKVLAALALLLAVLGAFSVVAYGVDPRRGEFGVRLAFGATPRDLAVIVLRRGVALGAAGVVLGGAGAVAPTRAMPARLFGVAGHDGWVLGGVAALLMVAAILACLWPARRATRVDVSRLSRSRQPAQKQFAGANGARR